jgi:hypothetical protein
MTGAPPTPTWSLTVPTDGASPYLLPLLAAASAASPAAIAVVWTAPGPPPPDLRRALDGLSCDVLPDDGPPNIQRWWNRGIAASPTDAVLVVNDDVSWSPSAPVVLAAALAASGATLAAPASPSPVLGWCFALDRSHGVLPDEGYRWFYGDDDLFRRAASEGRGTVRPAMPPPGVVHRKFRNAERWAFRDLCRADALRWAASAPSAPPRGGSGG